VVGGALRPAGRHRRLVVGRVLNLSTAVDADVDADVYVDGLTARPESTMHAHQLITVTSDPSGVVQEVSDEGLVWISYGNGPRSFVRVPLELVPSYRLLVGHPFARLAPATDEQ
jgi:hypothetical protein